TLRGDGDRSRRKSYDGFCPIGPFLVTADEIGDPNDVDIRLEVGGQLRQDISSGEMMVKIPEIIAHASSIMTLNPGDVITTGSPPGVGAIVPGDRMIASSRRIGRMAIDVRAPGT